MSIQRPRPGEDDLEEMMKSFEEQKASGSTKNVANKRRTVTTEKSAKKPKSRFAEQRARQKSANASKCPESDETLEIVDTTVLLDIVEKNFDCKLSAVPPKLPLTNQEARFFPDVIKVNQDLCAAKNKNTNQSIFAKQFQEMKKEIGKDFHQPHVSTNNVTLNTKVNSSNRFGDRSYVLSESNHDKEVIHKENVATLSQMSEEEINREREKLMKELDPNLVEFLKKKRKLVISEKTKLPICDRMDTVEETNTGVSTVQVKDDVDVCTAVADIDGTHMDVEEPAKSSWMADLPPASSSSNFLSARFDFSGNLLSLDDVRNDDVQQGLHHHGEEPERAGYTLDELLTFIRSTNSPQRVIGLKTLSEIFNNYNKGLLDDCLHQNLLSELLQSGLLTLLRVSLDAKDESVTSSAITCLSSLLYNELDEMCLDKTFHWLSGVVQPSLPGPPDPPEDPDNPTPDPTDHQLAQQDVVKALVRMDTLDRLVYILSVLRPGPAAVVSSLTFLTRMARHSLQVADIIARNNKLIDCIVGNFIVDHLPAAGHSSIYGSPVWQAVRLARVLVSWGRHLATTLVSRHRLADSLLVYIATGPEDCSLPASQALPLRVESYRCWRSLLVYGLATQHYIDMYPVIAGQLATFLDKVDCHTDRFTAEAGAGLLGALQAAVAAAGAGPPSLLHWDHVGGLLQPLEMCVAKWLSQAAREGVPDNDLIASSCNCLLSLYVKMETQSCYNPVLTAEKLSSLFSGPLKTFLTSPHFLTLCQNVKTNSGFLSGERSSDRAPDNLSSVNANLHRSDVHPVLKSGGTTNLLTSIFRFISGCLTLYRQLDVPPLLLQPMSGYLTNLATTPALYLSSNWFSRHEAEMLYWICLLDTQLHSLDNSTVHSAAVVTSQLLQTGDEFCLKNLLARVVFAPDYVASRSVLDTRLTALSINDATSLSSPCGLPLPSLTQVLDSALKHVLSIKETYVKLVTLPKLESASESLKVSRAGSVATLTQRNSGETILASDWAYTPLLALYSRTSDMGEEGPAAGADVQAVRECLAWVLLTDKECSTAREATARFVRLCTVFLAGPDLFLDPAVHCLTLAALKSILASGKLDLGLRVPGLTSNHELYLQMLSQFESVSYGDQLFSLFLIPPMTMAQPIEFRKSIWTEHPELLRMVTLTTEHIRPLDLNDLTEPAETEPTLLTSYYRSVVEGRVTPARNQLLYQLAVKQVNRFLTDQAENSNSDLRRIILQELKKTENAPFVSIFLSE